jgi:hypothetical protein
MEPQSSWSFHKSQSFSFKLNEFDQALIFTEYFKKNYLLLCPKIALFFEVFQLTIWRKFEVLTAVKMSLLVFRFVTQCKLACIYKIWEERSAWYMPTNRIILDLVTLKSSGEDYTISEARHFHLSLLLLLFNKLTSASIAWQLWRDRQDLIFLDEILKTSYLGNMEN